MCMPVMTAGPRKIIADGTPTFQVDSGQPSLRPGVGAKPASFVATGAHRRVLAVLASCAPRIAALPLRTPPVSRVPWGLLERPTSSNRRVRWVAIRVSDPDEPSLDDEDVERLVRLGPKQLIWPEVCARAEVSHEVADPLWRALGF